MDGLLPKKSDKSRSSLSSAKSKIKSLSMVASGKRASTEFAVQAAGVSQKGPSFLFEESTNLQNHERETSGIIQVSLDAPKLSDKCTTIAEVSVFENTQTVIQTVLALHQVDDKWQNYDLFMEFSSENQLAVVEGIELLGRDSIESMVHMIRNGQVTLPKERMLNLNEHPLLLKRKFRKVSEEPVFAARYRKEEEPKPVATPVVPKADDSLQRPLEKKNRRPRAQSFMISPFLPKRSFSEPPSVSAFAPKEVKKESPPVSPQEPVPAGHKGTITICSDLEKLQMEQIPILSTTTSQVLIQNKSPVRYMDCPLLAKEKLVGKDEPVFFLVNMRNKVLGEIDTVKVRYDLRKKVAGGDERVLPLKYFENRTTFQQRALKEIGIVAGVPAQYHLSVKFGAEDRPVLSDELPSGLASRNDFTTFVIHEKEVEGGVKSRARSSTVSSARPPSIRTEFTAPALVELETPTSPMSGSESSPMSGSNIIRLRLDVVETEPVMEMLVQCSEKALAVIAQAIEYFELSGEQAGHYSLTLSFNGKERVLRSLENPSSIQRKLTEGANTPVFVLKNTNDPTKKISKSPPFFEKKPPQPLPASPSVSKPPFSPSPLGELRRAKTRTEKSTRTPESPTTPTSPATPSYERKERIILNKKAPKELLSRSSSPSTPLSEYESPSTPQTPSADGFVLVKENPGGETTPTGKVKRRLSKSLSTDFSDKPKETGTIRVIFDASGVPSTMYKTMMISNRDRSKDVVKSVLSKYGIDLDSIKYYELLLNFGEAIRDKVLLSTDYPLQYKKDLSTPEGAEPIFEVKDVRTLVLSPATNDNEVRKRTRSNTFNAVLPSFVRKRMDHAEPGRSDPSVPPTPQEPERKNSNPKQATVDLLAVSPIPTTSESGAIRFHYLENYKALVVKAEDDTKTVVKECAEKFQLPEAIASNLILVFTQNGKDRTLTEGEKPLQVKLKAEKFSAAPILFELRENPEKLQTPLKGLDNEIRVRSNSITPSFTNVFKKLSGEKLSIDKSAERGEKSPEKVSPDKSTAEREQVVKKRTRGFTISSMKGAFDMGKEIEHKKQVFGVPLEEQLAIEKAEIPALVRECIAQVELRGLDLEGIYRLSGSTSRVKAMKQQYSLSMPPSLADEMELPNITSLLKDYFRELPVSLITPEVYSHLVRLLEAQPEHRTAEIDARLQELPPGHLRTLRVLLVHLRKVAAQHEVNKMDLGNLAVVFGPTLINVPGSLDVFGDVQAQTNLMHIILQFQLL